MNQHEMDCSYRQARLSRVTAPLWWQWLGSLCLVTGVLALSGGIGWVLWQGWKALGGGD